MLQAAATHPEVGLNIGGLVWILAVVMLAGVGVFVYQRRRSGLPPVTAALAIAAGAALLMLILGLAGLVVGAVVFAIFQLARLTG